MGMEPLTRAVTRAEIYAKYASELARFATSLVGPTDAADVVSEAVVKAMWSPTWPSVINPRSYLYQAVVNESRMHHRRSTRRRSHEMKTASPDIITVSALGVDVWEAMGRLTVPQRGCVFLRYWEGMTTDEIAEELAMSTRSVRRQLARARTTLRRILK
jgi:RNA polymerase sigma-70 factor (ECF subfamily)